METPFTNSNPKSQIWLEFISEVDKGVSLVTNDEPHSNMCFGSEPVAWCELN